MMERLQVTDDPADIGYYSGLVDSCFAIAQLLTVIYQWGKWSDRLGRKPIIAVGLIGVAISSYFFGLSTSLTTALISRSIGGVLSGNAVVVSSMISEMTDSTNQGKAFPLFGATWALGCVIGPIIGGNLSNPAERYPELFGRFQLLKDYPYFLPCIISSGITVLSLLLCLFFVDETLPRILEARKAKKDSLLSPSPSMSTYGSTSNTPTFGSRSHSPTPSNSETLVEDISEPPTPVSESFPSQIGDNKKETMSLSEILSYPTVRSIMVSSFMLSFVSMAFDVVFVLFSYTSIDLGGLGRTPQQIGFAMSASGVAGAIGSLFVFPFFQRTFNNRKLYTFLMSMWIVAFLFAPIGSMFIRLSHDDPTVAWLGIAFILAPVRIAVLNFPLNMILVRSSAPSIGVLGTIFGLQQTLGAFARAIGPAFISSLYAFSTDHMEILHGHLVWFVMVSLTIYGAYVSSRVRDIDTDRETLDGVEA
ncbi:major facilitator superfamily domain-containing protein [Cantharellus anzutake]|uniref:major facilitator superfamily domain-containing protein n=1 Tax=Cantharellus anzutake TaxID=1750568 RepID=UPI001906CBA4|nr:major facilitator superfamily domain-containing protein [Cantharellus anzutake]KAF8324456.1 major facilitator superfamily domain-containing protein [Cantharellus anzutake]